MQRVFHSKQKRFVWTKIIFVGKVALSFFPASCMFNLGIYLIPKRNHMLAVLCNPVDEFAACDVKQVMSNL